MREKNPSCRGMAGAEWLLVLLLLVIVILLLCPRINSRPLCAANVKQVAQLHSIDAAMELFEDEWDGSPLSDASDSTGQPYCGAMKLAEAIMGQGLLGFHRASGFRADGLDPGSGALLYAGETLAARMGPYLQLESAQPYRWSISTAKATPGHFRRTAMFYATRTNADKRLGL